MENETNVMLAGRDLAEKENLSVGQVCLLVRIKSSSPSLASWMDCDQDDQLHFFP